MEERYDECVFRINDTLFTAPVSERILDGITRKVLLT
jgi:branched-chain amino acid aminotransferase